MWEHESCASTVTLDNRLEPLFEVLFYAKIRVLIGGSTYFYDYYGMYQYPPMDENRRLEPHGMYRAIVYVGTMLYAKLCGTTPKGRWRAMAAVIGWGGASHRYTILAHEVSNCS